ncbi:putative exopolysaccharide biosynthesis polyprenyl glycosylphosphotransferase [Gordonia polyisoprenivorans VH2]|uniref:Putative exopolysaccharide biosynthesis polyprenyl glycosylphosphotransferase n=1 Tax=Gordonia polyisoprenivorans (strain DSM 44266 / VH2) TaxID=1112204 RepID=H6N1J4_GORPV|nr:exopolysaccharide biosynthesis polyprenyl glycosylphosphotransferase [Gordonia polyisoprenivorans]AFA72205.1 putative exopolysaccharide biosynthesis polyprenyl glycosylphosphotransferase [Gordonia polyisoprenivorans VH2]OZC29160.1 glycosyl transferase [Gordonia polyisoprenivorans]UZF57557.1 exopolysaccharide biosynthesis polyprenyl glycosylphosphotransferase [Gordonia polyisoprenivorans]HCS59178.1 glycosyl transferase [Gordonia polyisoprenivorans]
MSRRDPASLPVGPDRSRTTSKATSVDVASVRQSMEVLLRNGLRLPTLSPVRKDPVLIGLDAVVLIAIAIVTGTPHGASGVAFSILGALLTVVALDFAGLYRTRVTLSALDDMPRLAGWSIIASGVMFAVLRPGVHITRATVFAGCVFAALFVVRVAYFTWVRSRRRCSDARRMRVGVIGDGLVAAEIITSTRAQPELGVDVVTVVSSLPMQVLADTGVPLEGAGTSLQKLVADRELDALVVAFSTVADSALISPLRGCDELDCEIFVVPRLFEFTSLTQEMDRIHTVPLIRLRRDALRTWYWHLKRIFDLALVVAALVVAAPPAAIIACAIKLSDPRAPIIFRQQRIGHGGATFDLLKFRSMRPVATSASDREWQPVDADRIGRLGRFLRKTSLDELPQLWNVLRGDMSIVGPRPERPHFVEQFEGAVHSYADRHRVPVGLTGWAAINGLRGDTSISDRALYDNFYIENWSIWLDVKIIVRTVGAVMRGSGG